MLIKHVVLFGRYFDIILEGHWLYLDILVEPCRIKENRRPSTLTSKPLARPRKTSIIPASADWNCVKAAPSMARLLASREELFKAASTTYPHPERSAPSGPDRGDDVLPAPPPVEGVGGVPDRPGDFEAIGAGEAGHLSGNSPWPAVVLFPWSSAPSSATKESTSAMQTLDSTPALGAGGVEWEFASPMSSCVGGGSVAVPKEL